MATHSVFLPGESQGWGSLVGCCLWGCTELDMIEATQQQQQQQQQQRVGRIERAVKHILETEMATHSSVLAWRIPGTREPGGLPSMGSHRVRHG